MLFYPKGRVRPEAGAQSGRVSASAVGAETVVLPESQAGGVLPTTQIATPRGWIPASRLTAGDMVLTFDNGCQPLCAVIADPSATDTPVLVPRGALDNRSPLALMPGQVVLLDRDIAEDMFGDPFALVPAATLVGLHGIAVTGAAEVAALHLRFDTDEIIYAQGDTLLLCPAKPTASDAADDASGTYRPLPRRAARQFVRRLIDEETLSEAADGAVGTTVAGCL